MRLGCGFVSSRLDHAVELSICQGGYRWGESGIEANLDLLRQTQVHVNMRVPLQNTTTRSSAACSWPAFELQGVS